MPKRTGVGLDVHARSVIASQRWQNQEDGALAVAGSDVRRLVALSGGAAQSEPVWASRFPTAASFRTTCGHPERSAYESKLELCPQWPTNVRCDGGHAILLVSEGGLEPPRPLTGTSTSS